MKEKKPGVGEYLLSIGLIITFISLIALDYGTIRTITAIMGFFMIIVGIMVLKIELPKEQKQAELKTFEEAWRKKK